MKNKSIIVLVIIVMIYISISLQVEAQSEYGNFPYYQSFKTTVKPSEIEKITPQNGKNNAATFTADGLQLTSVETDKFGAIFVKDRRFQAIQGIRIEFEYAMYGGTGADGMSVFLFDASVANPTIGAPGAGIGYAYNRTNNDTWNGNVGYRAKGLSGAYLGIALDSYGNFKQRRWQGEARVNGIPGLVTSTDHRYVSNVTLRGAKGGSTQIKDFPYDGMGDGYNGYPVLISQPTLSQRKGWILHGSDGTYSDLDGTSPNLDGTSPNLDEYEYVYKGNFSLRGNSETDYRKAIIELFPFTKKDGFWVTVKIQHGETVTTVIEDYPYKNSIIYAENAYTTSGDYNTSNPGTPSSKTTTLNAAIPDYLRIGFAASTGGETDIHLIKEVHISLPRAAEAYDDSATTTKGKSVIVDVLSNDIGYSGLIAKEQDGYSHFLNPYAFRFCDATGAVLGVVDANGTSYSDASGTWRFDFITGKLIYTPVRSFVGQTTVNYTIKAGLNDEKPYRDEAYRSFPATVMVDVAPPKAVISNRMVTPIIR